VFAETVRLDKAVEIDGYADADLRVSLLKIAAKRACAFPSAPTPITPTNWPSWNSGWRQLCLAKIPADRINQFPAGGGAKRWSQKSGQTDRLIQLKSPFSASASTSAL